MQLTCMCFPAVGLPVCDQAGWLTTGKLGGHAIAEPHVVSCPCCSSVAVWSHHYATYLHMIPVGDLPVCGQAGWLLHTPEGLPVEELRADHVLAMLNNMPQAQVSQAGER